MNIKKIARPINKAKNEFLQWLRDRNAESIRDYTGGSDPAWNYYHCVSAFVGDSLHVVYFMIWDSLVQIEYKDGENEYYFDNVDDFLKLIR